MKVHGGSINEIDETRETLFTNWGEGVLKESIEVVMWVVLLEVFTGKVGEGVGVESVDG